MSRNAKLKTLRRQARNEAVSRIEAGGTVSYHDPRCIFRCILWGAVAAMLALLLSQYAQACSYTPDPVTIPPAIEVRI